MENDIVVAKYAYKHYSGVNLKNNPLQVDVGSFYST